jgi:transposase
MKSPLFVRPLPPEERRHLETGRRSRNAFTMRRALLVFASAAGQRPSAIAAYVGCASQTVRNVLRAFNAHGVCCVQAHPRRPKTVKPVFTEAQREQLRAILHQAPRQFGQPRSTWPLALAAEVCGAEGVTPRRVSDETIRQVLKRLGTRWRRAKHWITSPDPTYARKKSNETA